jgi:hypothetical protein
MKNPWVFIKKTNDRAFYHAQRFPACPWCDKKHSTLGAQG